jgi:hypothetical protein
VVHKLETKLAYITMLSTGLKSKTISNPILVTGRGSPWGCETSKVPHFLDNWLIDGC